MQQSDLANWSKPSKTEYKDVSPGKVTTTTIDRSPVSPALDKTVTTTTYTDPYPYYPYRSYYPYSRYYDYPYYSRYYDPYYYPYSYRSLYYP